MPGACQLEYGAEHARPVDCTPTCPRRPRRLAVRGAFHITHRRQDVLQHHAARPAVTGTLLVGRCTRRVDIWGDGSTYKGNDIERFYRYGLLVNPELRVYKPWLDQQFVDELGGRAEMSEFLIARTCRIATPRRRRTPPTPTSGAQPTRRRRSRSCRRGWNRRADHGRGPLATRRRHRQPRTCGSASRSGWPVALERRRSSPTRSPWSSRPTPSAGATAGMSDQIENRIIEAKSRGIYEAPALGLLHIAYERLVRRSTTRARSRTTARWAAASGGCSTRAAGSTRRA